MADVDRRRTDHGHHAVPGGSGLTLIFGLMDVLNFAHAAFVTVGAYIAVRVLRPLAGWTANCR